MMGAHRPHLLLYCLLYAGGVGAQTTTTTSTTSTTSTTTSTTVPTTTTTIPNTATYWTDTCTCCNGNTGRFCSFNATKADEKRTDPTYGFSTVCPCVPPSCNSYTLAGVPTVSQTLPPALTGVTFSFTCITTTSTTTTSTTTPSTTTTTGCEDLNNNGICDKYELLRCETKYLTKTNLLVAKILCYIATAWVVLWCLITIIVNIMHKNSGHHRGIHLVEELGIIVLWIFMGALNLTFRNSSGFCKAISVAIHYFVVFVAACFVFEAFFAYAMVRSKKIKNGVIPAFINYILPVLIALIPCLVTFFMKKSYYGANGIHCFAYVSQEYMYAFIIPVWILLVIATLRSSLGNLACDQTIPTQDQKQCYWGKKSCKMLSFLAYWIFIAYLTCMFGSSNQLLWVLIVFFLQSLVLGPLIFVVHTYGHLNTVNKWYKPSCFGKFYTPCPEKVNTPRIFAPPPPPPPPPASPPPKESPKKKKRVDPPPREQTPPPRASPPRQPPPPQSYIPPPPSPPPKDTGHTRAQDLWGWATTDGKNARKDDVLFRPRAY